MAVTALVDFDARGLLKILSRHEVHGSSQTLFLSGITAYVGSRIITGCVRPSGKHSGRAEVTRQRRRRTAAIRRTAAAIHAVARSSPAPGHTARDRRA